MDREVDIENRFSRWCEEKGLMCVKLNISGRRGMPDRIVLGDKKIIFIEFKAPNGKVKKLQRYVHQKIAEKGFLVFVIDSFKDAVYICERYLL